MNASFTGTEICVHEDRGRQRERGGKGGGGGGGGEREGRKEGE